MTLLAEIEALKSRIGDKDLEDTATRKQLLEKAKDLVLALEKPDDVIERVCYQFVETATIKLAIEMGILKQITSATAPLSAEEIAKNVPADPALIGRVMRGLSAWGAVKESESGYSASMVTQTFANSRNEAAMETCFNIHAPGWLQIPAWLKSLNYQTPSDQKYTAIHAAEGVPPGQSHIFDLFFKSPHLQAFGSYMGTFTQGHCEFLSLYPLQDRIISGFSEDADPKPVLFVDVGGGFGHQAQLVRKAFPDAPGRFVVQDMQPMKGADIPGIDFMAYDYYTPQPVVGARCYYLRFVLHDHVDEYNLPILKQLKDAMKPGYSKLVINEWIVPEMGASRFFAAEDLNMMSVGAIERTEKQWRALLDAAGFAITGIFRATDGISESVIEAVVS